MSEHEDASDLLPPEVGPLSRDLRAVRAVIQERRATLPKRLLQVADYALAHPREIAFGTAASVAAQAAVQPSTLVRFAQAIGFSGFSDLQSVFRAHARDRWPDYDQRLDSLLAGRATDEPAALLHGLIEAATTSAARLGETIDGESLSRAIALLAAADVIYLIGLRRSAPVVVYLTYALRRLSVRCTMIDQGAGLANEEVAHITPADAVLAVSFAPYAAATIEWATSAATRGVALVAVTDSPFSPLVEPASAWLEVVDADHLGFRSLTGAMTLATTLALSVARRRREGSRGIDGRAA